MTFIEAVDMPSYVEINKYLSDLSVDNVSPNDSYEKVYGLSLIIDDKFSTYLEKDGPLSLKYLRVSVFIKRILLDRFNSDAHTDDFIIASKLVFFINSYPKDEDAKFLLNEIVSIWISEIDFDEMKSISRYFYSQNFDELEEVTDEEANKFERISNFRHKMLVLKDLEPDISSILNNNFESVDRAFKLLNLY